MASSYLPEPGTANGPCIEQDCGHKDCAETRRMAASVCPYCGKPLGYETHFYNTQECGLVHATCEEDAYLP